MASLVLSFNLNDPDEVRALAQRLTSPSFAPKPRFPGVENGHTIGMNNVTNNPIIKVDSGNSVEAPALSQTTSIQSGQKAIVDHDQSNTGSRVVTSRFGGNVRLTSREGSTPNSENESEIDICNDAGTNDGDNEEPEEPEEPEPESPPEEPPPGAPEEPPETPPSPGEGCRPDDDCQWYNSSGSSSSACPSGTTYKGFAELSDGSFKVLCCGESRPAGDGCPEEVAYGWQCINGSCELLPAGLYATQAECEQQCGQDEPCLDWAIEGGQCTNVGCGNGAYGSQEECNKANVGQCEGAIYRVEWCWLRTASDPTSVRCEGIQAEGPLSNISTNSFNCTEAGFSARCYEFRVTDRFGVEHFEERSEFKGFGGPPTDDATLEGVTQIGGATCP